MPLTLHCKAIVDETFPFYCSSGKSTVEVTPLMDPIVSSQGQEVALYGMTTTGATEVVDLQDRKVVSFLKTIAAGGVGSQGCDGKVVWQFKSMGT